MIKLCLGGCGRLTSKSRCKACSKTRAPVACMDCGKPTMQHSRGRCPSCDAYSDPAWRREFEAARAEAQRLGYLMPWCERCKTTEDLTVDHIDGDRFNNVAINLCSMCRSCNSIKRGEQARQANCGLTFRNPNQGTEH